MNLPLAGTQLELNLENFPEIDDNHLFQNFKDDEFEITREADSIIYNNQNTETFSTGMNEARSSKNFSPVTQRSNTSASSEQISTPSSETTLVKGTEYTFYDDNGNKFIIDNADFEEEEEELTDIFNPNSALVSNYLNFKIDSYNERFHFIPIPMGASSDNCTDEDDDKENVITSTSNTNPFLPIAKERPSYNLTDEDEENVASSIPNTNHFLPITTFAPSYKCTDEDDNEENGVTSTPNSTSFLRIETDASFDIRTDEDDDEENVVASTPNTNHFLPVATDSSSNNLTDEEDEENVVASSPKKNVFKKMKSFFKKVRTDCRNCFSYKRFQ
ncbi:hypothetical protein TNCT_572741 [Trichonephila clavata]|uniref:Uncharacterized protein n=1 Tax=Trichonephila clavata TaxID=2740835 RepID=A0A8X6LDW1_TRICU|nr:hypothetical protein TNCT_572741 [Trichonephila clavata]